MMDLLTLHMSQPFFNTQLTSPGQVTSALLRQSHGPLAFVVRAAPSCHS